MDEIGWQLLSALQQNARLTFAELGRRVGLSLPAVADRVRRMEEAGIIEGYRAEVSAELLGLPLIVFIQLKTGANSYTKLVQQVEHMPEILECHHITGGDSFIMKAAVRSKEHLAEIICCLSPFGPTTTSLVLSTPVSHRVLANTERLEYSQYSRNKNYITLAQGIYATAEITNHNFGEPFSLGQSYELQTNLEVRGPTATNEGDMFSPNIESQKSSEIEIDIWAEDIDIKPEHRQTCTFDFARESQSKVFFELKPLKAGKKLVKIDFIHKLHWLANIEFEINVVTKVLEASSTIKK